MLIVVIVIALGCYFTYNRFGDGKTSGESLPVDVQDDEEEKVELPVKTKLSLIMVGDAFRDLGFNLVSLANNHTLDRGENAIINSKNYWNQFEDIITAGSYSSEEDRENIKILEKNGISYTLLSYTDLTNGLRSPEGKDLFS
mgnify:CR=1 FL=1